MSEKNAKPASQSGKPEAEHSPWTEPFQRSQDSGAFDSTAQNQKSAHQSAHRANAGSKPAAQHTDEATHDALSTIFNGN